MTSTAAEPTIRISGHGWKYIELNRQRCENLHTGSTGLNSGADGSFLYSPSVTKTPPDRFMNMRCRVH